MPSPILEFQIKQQLQGAQGPLQLDLNGTLLPGQSLAVFGASGAGKTTLLRMFAGLVSPSDGRIVFDGEVWFDSSQKICVPSHQRSIGMVFQNYALFPHLNVRENIAFAVDRQEKKWIDYLLELSDLVSLQSQSVMQLSGGQKQRVALARALARKPKLLLLDEPMSALDQHIRAQMQNHLMMMQREFAMTSILVSHDHAEVFKLADQVIYLQNGRVLRAGTPQQVFLNHSAGSKLNLQAQVLAIRKEEIVIVLSLLIGQDIIEIIASEEDAKRLKVGDRITIATKAFSPQITLLR